MVSRHYVFGLGPKNQFDYNLGPWGRSAVPGRKSAPQSIHVLQHNSENSIFFPRLVV